MTVEDFATQLTKGLIEAAENERSVEIVEGYARRGPATEASKVYETMARMVADIAKIPCPELAEVDP